MSLLNHQTETANNIRFTYEPGFLSVQQADAYQSALTSPDVCWSQEKFRIFGRDVPAPRRLVWFGDGGLNFRYTGVDHIAQGWPDWLVPLLTSVREAANESFNFVLVNQYADGTQHMGWHRDDERGTSPLIGSVSLGASRPFLYRLDNAERSSRVVLEHGSLCTFDGRIRHRLPPTRRVKSPRINLTFRRILH